MEFEEEFYLYENDEAVQQFVEFDEYGGGGETEFIDDGDYELQRKVAETESAHLTELPSATKSNRFLSTKQQLDMLDLTMIEGDNNNVTSILSLRLSYFLL